MLQLKSLEPTLITVIVFLSLNSLIHSLVIKFTKFECFEFDKPFADIPKCQLKAFARDKVGLNLHVRLHQVPVNNVSVGIVGIIQVLMSERILCFQVNAAFFNKDFTQRYKPFMYNSSLDFCKFLKTPNRFLFWKIVYGIIKTSSNINHTCPYDVSN